MLGEIEEGTRDHHVRQAVNGLLLSLSHEVQAEAAGAFWRSSRALAVACYESGLDLDIERPALKAMTDAAADCRLIAIQHADHDQFFDDVASAMWDAVSVISPA